MILAFLLFQLKKQQDTHSGQAQIYLKILERMETVRPDRAALRKFIHSRVSVAKDNTVEHWRREDALSETMLVDYLERYDPLTDGPHVSKEPVHRLLDRLAREFDILAFMDRKHLISQDLVDEFYAASIRDFIPIFRVYIEKLRIAGKREETYLWELEQFMNRVEKVPLYHPGLTKQSAWPKNPRRISSPQPAVPEATAPPKLCDMYLAGNERTPGSPAGVTRRWKEKDRWQPASARERQAN